MSAVANLLMKITHASGGDIEGESTIEGFVKWIDIDDWNWALGFEAPPRGEGQTSHGRIEEAVPSVLTFGKLMDRASTAMLAAMSAGDELSVTLWMADVSDRPFGLKIECTEARLIDYDASFKSEEKGVSVEESWILDYREIKFSFQIGNRPGPEAPPLERPAWASTSKPKGQGPTEEVIKLTENLKPNELNELWEKMKKANEAKRGKQKEKEEEGS